MNGSRSSLIAADVGNNRVKFGWFSSVGLHSPPAGNLPHPVRTLAISGNAADFERLASCLEEASENLAWHIGSVNRAGAEQLVEWLARYRPGEFVKQLTFSDLPLEIALKEPERAGMDRLLNAVAANRLRQLGHCSIVVDVGSAITVDRISADGTFLGGAILPGMALSARALHTFTDLLPLVDMADLAGPPSALGKATTPAIRSGLFWGSVGAIRELVARLTADSRDPADVILTGGASAGLATLFEGYRHVPHLTLAGIAIAAGRG